MNPYGYEGTFVNEISKIVKGMTPYGEVPSIIRVLFTSKIGFCGAIIFEGRASIAHAICTSICYSLRTL